MNHDRTLLSHTFPSNRLYKSLHIIMVNQKNYSVSIIHKISPQHKYCCVHHVKLHCIEVISLSWHHLCQPLLICPCNSFSRWPALVAVHVNRWIKHKDINLLILAKTILEIDIIAALHGEHNGIDFMISHNKDAIEGNQLGPIGPLLLQVHVRGYFPLLSTHPIRFWVSPNLC